MERTRPVLTTANCFEIIPVDNVKSQVRRTGNSGGNGGAKGGKGR